MRKKLTKKNKINDKHSAERLMLLLSVYSFRFRNTKKENEKARIENERIFRSRFIPKRVMNNQFVLVPFLFFGSIPFNLIVRLNNKAFVIKRWIQICGLIDYLFW